MHCFGQFMVNYFFYSAWQQATVAYKDILFACSHKGMKKRQLLQKDEQEKQKNKIFSKITVLCLFVLLIFFFSWEFT